MGDGMMNNKQSHRLWYKQPAQQWEHALPIGNGKIGGMVFGTIETEQIQLNEDTLWSGFPRDTNNYEALRYLKTARELISKGSYAEAEAIVENKMLALNCQAYQPFGSLHVQWLNAPEAPEQYERGLDLQSAIAYTTIEHDGRRYSRHAWVSAAHRVYVLSYHCEELEGSDGREAGLDLQAGFELPHPAMRSYTNSAHVINGRCPSHIADNYFGDHPYAVQYEDKRGIIFQSRLKAVSDGSITYSEQGIKVAGASYVHFIGSIATSFTAFNEQPHQSCELLSAQNNAAHAEISGYSYEELLKTHILEHQRLYNRVSFTLGPQASDLSALPTDARLEHYQQGGHDPELESLYFHYGRYLLITSSRPGTQPANLQGIWNDRVQPAWNSDYTTNINTQMNYWSAELVSLSECHEPLLQMIEQLQVTGARTARIHYQASGWVAHHNVDLWRMSSPTAGHPSWAFWPMGGVWLTQHVWERYLFHPDPVYLQERAYPIMKGAAQFCLDWLIEDEAGRLITSPSTSPENKFLYDHDKVSSVAQASAMDMTLITELFQHVVQASQLLEEDEAFREQVEVALSKLPGLKINEAGLLQEWDCNFAEQEPGHRHVSHLYGLYPGTTIAGDELLEAARRSLSSRIANGGGHTGWSCAWLINLYARLGMEQETYRFIRTLLERSTYPNLFDAHPPFQIDGNFGGVAGMVEALVQSHKGYIELLPALPSVWKSGEITGLTARGGFQLSICWQQAKLVQARITSLYGLPLTVRYNEKLVITDEATGQSYRDMAQIATIKGRSYLIELAK